MGKLKAVWTDLPDADDEYTFKKEFNHHFGSSWDKVMLGAEKPFDQHRYWDGYFAVTDVVSSNGLTLLDVTGAGGSGVKPLCYNVIVV
ncbi:hypothetical protein [Desulfoscipio gibsoniae]|uniref:hypothetical protein n=1 Tax=Desulfoscipio gibsoniae TaxID=102134 RepID=UPI00030F7898|nr:hypothetical protein [Desulfoscipio gibsoniae]